MKKRKKKSKASVSTAKIMVHPYLEQAKTINTYETITVVPVDQTAR